MDRTDVPCKIGRVIERGISMDANFLKAQAERCRLLAKNADEFTKRRLFVLAVHYEKRLRAAEMVGRDAHSQNAAQYPRRTDTNLIACAF